MTPIPTANQRAPTIGVFDSGVGGLTVLRALTEHLPDARFLYLGDTARLPYGSKSPATVARYAVSAARFLVEEGAGMLVIACNTATALALPAIRSAVAPLPVLGVIEPGAQAARAQLVSSAPSGHVLVLATSATVNSHAYSEALGSFGLRSLEKACPLFVPLVEEGWTDHPVTAEVARIYLREALAKAPHANTLLLGCTHYPLLQALLAQTLQELSRPMTIIDSATATAHAVRLALATHAGAPVEDLRPAEHRASLVVYATDSVARFQQLGSRFLGRPLPTVQLIELDDRSDHS